MKVIVFLCILGLSLATVNVDGLVVDGIKTYQDATSQKPNVATLVQDGVNIVQDLTDNQFGYLPTPEQLQEMEAFEREEEEGLIAFVDVDGLVVDGIKTYQDATAQKPNVATLVQDGANIVQDLTNNQFGYMPTEEQWEQIREFEEQEEEQELREEENYLQFGYLPTPEQLQEMEAFEREEEEGLIAFVNVDGLVVDGIKTYQDATSQKPNGATLVQDGVNIVQDLTDNQFGYLPTPEQLQEMEAFEREEEEGLIAFVELDNQFGYLPTPEQLQEMEAFEREEEEGLIAFVNVDGLVVDGIKTYQDATSQKPNVASLVQDGVNIVQDLSDNQLGFLSVEKSE